MFVWLFDFLSVSVFFLFSILLILYPTHSDALVTADAKAEHK
jgi:hypothetical protein